MNPVLIYPIGVTPACQYAVSHLQRFGFNIVDHPTPEVTHLFLDVPSFSPSGSLRSGAPLSPILEMLPTTVTVIGGNLQHSCLSGYNTFDLLTVPDYLAQNAAITADCALQTAAPILQKTLYDSHILILGWGRIGKCLGQILKAIGSNLIIAARKDSDRAMIQALGINAADFSELPSILPKLDLIFNTIPKQVLTSDALHLCPECVKIDLASVPGLVGEDVHYARGLPGICAPMTSGHLIAQTIRNHFKEES